VLGLDWRRYERAAKLGIQGKVEKRLPSGPIGPYLNWGQGLKILKARGRDRGASSRGWTNSHVGKGPVLLRKNRSSNKQRTKQGNGGNEAILGATGRGGKLDFLYSDRKK